MEVTGFPQFTTPFIHFSLSSDGPLRRLAPREDRSLSVAIDCGIREVHAVIGTPGMALRSALGGLLLAVMVFDGVGSVAAAPIPADGLGQEAWKLPPGAFRRLGDVRMRFGNTLLGMVAIPGGRTIATATEKGISIWDPVSGFELATAPLPEKGSGRALPRRPEESSHSLIVSRDGKYLILVTGDRLWRYALPLKGAPEPWAPEAPARLFRPNFMRLQHLVVEHSFDIIFGVTSENHLFEWKRGDGNWIRIRGFQGFYKSGKLAIGGDYIATTVDDG